MVFIGLMPLYSPAMPKNKLKHHKIFQDLVQEIHKGTYRQNSQLPSERGLAEQYGVSRGTARRALSDISTLGLAVRRGRKGTIMVPGSDQCREETLNLVCTAEPLADVEDFLRVGLQIAEKKHWRVKVTRFTSNDESAAWQSLAMKSLHLILAEGFEFGLGEKILKALSKTAARSVVLATRLDDVGIASVVCDDRKGMKLALGYLKKLGHRKIALVIGGETIENPVLALMLREWKNQLLTCMTAREFQDCLVRVEHAPFQDLALRCREVVSGFIRTPAFQGVTAFLCLRDEFAVGTAAACRQAKIMVPAEISIMCYGITERANLREMPFAGISVQIDQHVATAIDIVEESLKRGAPRKLLKQIKPLLIEGASVGPAPRR